jgi:hypothetical protein
VPVGGRAVEVRCVVDVALVVVRGGASWSVVVLGAVVVAVVVGGAGFVVATVCGARADEDEVPATGGLAEPEVAVRMVSTSRTRISRTDPSTSPRRRQ